MALVAAVVWRQGGGYGASLIRVALMHGSSPCNEKWDNKWKSVKAISSLRVELHLM